MWIELVCFMKLEFLTYLGGLYEAEISLKYECLLACEKDSVPCDYLA
jgi:hypothetical protein